MASRHNGVKFPPPLAGKRFTLTHNIVLALENLERLFYEQKINKIDDMELAAEIKILCLIRSYMYNFYVGTPGYFVAVGNDVSPATCADFSCTHCAFNISNWTRLASRNQPITEHAKYWGYRRDYNLHRASDNRHIKAYLNALFKRLAENIDDPVHNALWFFFVDAANRKNLDMEV